MNGDNSIIADTYLEELPEQLPLWLEEFRPGDRFDRAAFFSSRVVYYPGALRDVHALRLFSSTRSAHSFIYVDYSVKGIFIESALRRLVNELNSYDIVSRIELSKEDLNPGGWQPHSSRPYSQSYLRSSFGPYGFIAIVEREPSHSARSGVKRFAFMYLSTDGIATYDALFCQGDGTPPPFAVLLQDHGFGGNYNLFGHGGLMEEVALSQDALPQFLLVGDNTLAWDGYARIEGLIPEPGGMHKHERSLYEKVRKQPQRTHVRS